MRTLMAIFILLILKWMEVEISVATRICMSFAVPALVWQDIKEMIK